MCENAEGTFEDDTYALSLVGVVEGHALDLAAGQLLLQALLQVHD